jgi:hypothetical protein
LATIGSLAPGVANALDSPQSEKSSTSSDRECASAAGSCNPAAESCHPERPLVGAEADLNSRFVWRGVAYSAGPVLQPSTWVSVYGFTANVLATLLVNDEPPRRRLVSVVPSLGYAYAWLRLTVEPGMTVYFSHDDVTPETTVEASFNGSFRLGAFKLVSTNNVDVRSHRGAYFGTLGAKYETSSERWTIEGAVDVGGATAPFNEAYFQVATAAIGLAEASLQARYDISDVFYFALHTEASVLLAPSLRSAVAEPMLMNGGVAVGAEY